jgi:hypothetical protein
MRSVGHSKWAVLALVIFLTACAPSAVPLPTIAVVAALPSYTPTAVPIPITFTALPEHYATPTHTPTATPTATLTLTPTIPASATATHFAEPDF